MVVVAVVLVVDDAALPRPHSLLQKLSAAVRRSSLAPRTALASIAVAPPCTAQEQAGVRAGGASCTAVRAGGKHGRLV